MLAYLKRLYGVESYEGENINEFIWDSMKNVTIQEYCTYSDDYSFVEIILHPKFKLLSCSTHFLG